ncbi:hypothetical protein [Shewanella baltica]|uniref:hypothetical protein n=1 Tax=Shewanella baltica TaxID=62322 RepID=UPI00217E529C|nr:hypothetical protein [Shewanella baltica]MCS6241388.1 hypothetical protein [Shewanella baltica]
MKSHEQRGLDIRALSKELVIDFMKSKSECAASSVGLSQAEIFRSCGFDWGTKKSATSSNQQYWVAALLRELEDAGIIERTKQSGPWRLV